MRDKVYVSVETRSYEFAKAFIQGESSTVLKELATKIPLQEWCLCFDGWAPLCDVAKGFSKCGITNSMLIKIIAKVGYELSTNKPMSAKIHINADTPSIYANKAVPSECQIELVKAYQSVA